MSGPWVAVCETGECGWQGRPQESHFGAVCDMAHHVSDTGTHDGRVYAAEEVGDGA